MSKTRNSWRAMRQRCYNPNCADYPAYGGRGITCPEAWATYAAFLADMGECPPEHTLHRKNNALPYSKDNCKWASHRVQRLVQTRTPGQSGLFGVYWHAQNAKWVARTTERAYDNVLYYGNNLLDAACARKSWENTRSHNSERKIQP